MKRYEVLNGQSLMDIAVQEYGSADAALDIAAENNMAVHDRIAAGYILTLPDRGIDDNRTVTAFRLRNCRPATALNEEDRILLSGGIGNMGINIDFVVS